MAKRKDAMALFEAISKTQAKPGGQVLPPHVGISPQPVKAESRAVLYVPPTEGGETAEPGAAPPPPPVSGARGTWVPAAKPPSSPDRTGASESVPNGSAGGHVAAPGAPANGYVPETNVPVGGYVPATERTPESAVVPVVVRPPKTSAAPPRQSSVSNGVPMARAAMSAPPTTRGDSSSGWSKPRLVALILAAVLVVGAIWYVAVKPGSSRNPAGSGDGPSQASVGAVGQDEELPPPPEFLPGKWYLVVESISPNEANPEQAAVHIATWLTQRDVPAAAKTTRRAGRDIWVVMAYQRFDEVPWRDVNGKPVYNPGPTEFAKKIEGLGKEYFRQFRTYQFKQTNPKGEFTPLYVRISGS